MPCQEDIFRFFERMSRNLDQEGYPILNDLRHEFPNIPWYEEILEDLEDSREIENMVNSENN